MTGGMCEADYREFVAAHPSPAPDVLRETQQLHTLLMALLEQHLEPLDREVITSHYGLTDHEGIQLATLAQQWGVAAPRLQESEAHALCVLKAHGQRLRIFLRDYTDHDSCL